MSNGMFFKGVALGAVVSVVLLSAQAAFAGTGVGAIFNLGRTNSVNGATTLTGTTAGSQLQVTNKSTSSSAFGLSITTSTARPPLKVNSQKVVTNLNSNFLQGKRASDFLAATGTAANASKLGGKAPADYLLATGTAADADKLGGVAADEYVSGCPLLTGLGEVWGYNPWAGAQVGGSVAARAEVKSPTGTLSANGVIAGWTCSGGPVWAEKVGTGQYCVVLDPTVSVLDTVGGETYYGLPHSPGRVAAYAVATSQFAVASGSEWTSCGGTTGIPGQPQYLGYFVQTHDVRTGEYMDAPFAFVAM